METNTADILDKLNQGLIEPDPIDQADYDKENPIFKTEFEEAIISFLLDFPEWVPLQFLKPDFFGSITTQYVIAAIIQYVEKYSVVPTRPALTASVVEVLTVDDPYEQITALIERKSDPREIPLVKERLRDWCRDRAYKLLYKNDAIEAVHRGDYAYVTNLIAQASLLSSPLEGEPFDFEDASAFMQEEIKLEWLIDGLLVANQPCIVGGKDKCLKTGTVCDLAISLATGTPFLDHFDVPKPRRVAFFSAESGKLDIQRRFKTILQAKGVQLPPDMLKITFTRPQLSNMDDLIKLGQMIERYKAEVVIVDPLYLTLLAGDDSNTSASDLYGMGNKFGTLSDVIAKAGATAILVHHYKKTTDEGVLGLNEFTFTGASAFARQSLHIGRRQPYSGPTTNHMRFMNHGFANGATYALDINEETWETRIEPEAEAVVRAVTSKRTGDLRKVINFLTVHGPSSKTRIRTAVGFNESRLDQVVALSGGKIEEYQEGGKRLYRVAETGEETAAETAPAE